LNYKFIYCIDKEIKNKLLNKLELIDAKTINGKQTWIFENSNKVQFNNEDMSKLEFTNKFYI
jgi:hypothetical protein